MKGRSSLSIWPLMALALSMVLGMSHVLSVLGAPTADGDLDPSFGTGGKITTAFPGGSDVARAAVIQPDQKIVLAGGSGTHFSLARYNPDGSLDPSFGSGGKVVAGFGANRDQANALARQPDGKLVAGGVVFTDTRTSRFALARFNVDGSPDATFGNGGKVITQVGPYDGEIAALVVQADGKIVAAGSTTDTFSKFVLVRYMPNGAIDTEFGDGGKVVTEISRDSVAYALALQANGKLIAAGRTAEISGDESVYDFALARFLPDGSLDTSFGVTGTITTDFGRGEAIRAIAIQGDGKIVAVGHTSEGPYGDSDFALARYERDGSLDTTFSTDGKVITEFADMNPVAAWATVVVIQPNGKIVAAGRTEGWAYTTGYSYTLARYNVDGSPDSSFSMDGKVIAGTSSSLDEANALVLQSNGALVVAGATANDALPDFSLMRYTPGGTLDISFGTGGRVHTDLAAGNDVVKALAFQSDGKIVAVGSSQVGGGSDFTLARYMADGTLDLGFGTGGRVTTDFLGTGDEANAALLQPDSKIVAVGSYNSASSVNGGFALARYNPDGSLDHSFGGSGKVTTSLGDSALGVLYAATLQPDGKIVVAGTQMFGDCMHYCGSYYAVARYNPDGTLDADFSGDGLVVLTETNQYERARAVAVQSDGKIVIAGVTYLGPGRGLNDFGMARLNGDGSIDTGFGDNGKVHTDFAEEIDEAYALALQPDGKIVVAGSAGRAGCSNSYCGLFGLVRYLPDGNRDGSFGNGGKVTTQLADIDAANAIVLQPDGKIIAAGMFSEGRQQRSRFALARYSVDGDLDPGFGVGGKVTTNFGNIGAAYAVGLQPGGKVVAAGQGDTYAGGRDFALARYANTLPPPPTTTPHAGRFEDVPPPSAFYPYIECMGAQGTISGYPCGGPGETCVGPTNKPYFRPNNNITRGQLSKIVANSAAFNEPVSSVMFEDVLPANTFYEFVQRMATRGIIGGYPCGGANEPCGEDDKPYFRPNANATRGQISKIVSQARGYNDPSTRQTFEDVPSTNSFYLYIERLASRGIMGGYPCGTLPDEPCSTQNRPYFRWGTNATRGQTSKIVSNTFFPNCQTANKP
jgi:uncharacterized delta-60 repeat protein